MRRARRRLASSGRPFNCSVAHLFLNLRHEFANTSTFRVIHLQQRHCRSTYRCSPNDVLFLVSKMVKPPIVARMEQAHYFTGVRINPRQVWALAEIAVRTGESEIICIVIPTVLARNNVLFVEAQFGKFLRGPAVLTVLARPHADKLAQLYIHQAKRRWDAAEKREPRPLTHLVAC
jgi:hypothetical protein